MKQATQKLKRKAGESITETLVALLIAALALVMLAVAVTTSADLVVTSRNKLDAYYTANEQADGVVKMQSGADAEPGITITPEDGAFTQPNSAVTWFVNDAFGRTPVVGYRIKD